MTRSMQFPVPRGAEQFAQYMELARIALRMQQTGWRVDRDRLKQHLQDAKDRQTKYGAKFAEITGIKELGKDGQLQVIKDWFWLEKKVPVVSIDRKTKKPKLDAAALLTYATESEDEAVQKASVYLYGYRRGGKTISFCEDYLERSAADGRVHPSFNVIGTKGSRWSSSGPNIQQLPSKDVKDPWEKGAYVAVSLKDICVADEGYVILDADYAALELYLQTYIAGAAKLLTAITEGRDLHLLNAGILFGTDRVPATATKDTHKIYREVSKLAYGFAYNASDHIAQVHKQMKGKIPELTEADVQEFRKRYFGGHPEFPGWQRSTMEQVKAEGYISTPLMDRRLYVENSMRGFNQALNGQAQITGGDLMNFAIIGLYGELRWAEGEQIRAQVHDSLVLQTRPEWVPETAEKLVRHMTSPVQIYGRLCRFVAEPGVGDNWSAMKDVDKWLKSREK